MDSLLRLRISGSDPVFPVVSGQANAGYLTGGDIVTKTADGIDLNDLWREFINATSVFNEHKASLVQLLTYSVTSNVEYVPQMGELVFEEASEFGIPRGGKTNIGYYQLAYDFKDYDLKIAYTWKFLRDSSAEQVAALHSRAFDADRDLQFVKVMAAIFDNESRTALINENIYSVFPLVNADGWVPPKYKGKSFDGTHNHYLATGSADLDPGDIENAINHLTEHGYGRDTGTRIIFFCNQAQIEEVITWKKGTAYHGVTAKYDFVPSAAQPPQFVPNGEGILGEVPPDRWNGMWVEGSYKNAWFIEEPTMPEGSILGIATGGANSAENLVGVRIHPSPEWQGLRMIPGNQARYPLLDAYYMHGFGTGIRNRTGAVVLQLGAGPYVTPDEFLPENLR